jgi:hypothetical protein
MAKSAHQLEYVGSKRRNWRGIRWLIIAMAAMILDFAWHNGSDWCWRCSFAWGVHRAMSDSLPPGTISYSDDPAVMAGIIMGDSRYSAELRPWRHIALRPPQFMVWFQRGALIFTHDRNMVGGADRLVTIVAGPLDAATGYAPGERDFYVYVNVMAPGTPWRLPVSQHVSWGAMCVIFRTTDRITILSGQPDLADTSHLTFEINANGTRQIVDGWLRNNDVVELVPRTGTYNVSNFPYYWPTATRAYAPGADPLSFSSIRMSASTRPVVQVHRP